MESSHVIDPTHQSINCHYNINCEKLKRGHEKFGKGHGEKENTKEGI